MGATHHSHYPGILVLAVKADDGTYSAVAIVRSDSDAGQKALVDTENLGAQKFGSVDTVQAAFEASR